MSFHNCFTCRVCPDSGYQTGPMYYAGNPQAQILVIAQNPGEVKESDKMRMRMVEILGNISPAEISGDALKMWYTLDFASSKAYVLMSQVFGENWITEDGIFAYTNSVRCRTPKNLPPNAAMVSACGVWTRKLVAEIQPKGIILLGSLAAQQMEAESLPVDVMKKHPKYGPMLRLRHFATWWNPADTVKRYEELVENFLSRTVK